MIRLCGRVRGGYEHSIAGTSSNGGHIRQVGDKGGLGPNNGVRYQYFGRPRVDGHVVSNKDGQDSNFDRAQTGDESREWDTGIDGGSIGSDGTDDTIQGEDNGTKPGNQ